MTTDQQKQVMKCFEILQRISPNVFCYNFIAGKGMRFYVVGKQGECFVSKWNYSQAQINGEEPSTISIEGLTQDFIDAVLAEIGLWCDCLVYPHEYEINGNVYALAGNTGFVFETVKEIKINGIKDPRDVPNGKLSFHIAALVAAVEYVEGK